MTIPAALSTIIATVFVFGLLSLFCSALTETASNLLEKRARYLLTGLRSMLDEPESSAPTQDKQSAARPTPDKMHDMVKQPDIANGAADRVRALVTAVEKDDPRPALQNGDLTVALFGHPLIRSLQVRRVRPKKKGEVRNPQYLPPKLFARALIDTLMPRPAQGASDADVLKALSKVVNALGTVPARKSLLALIDQASGNLQRLEESVESWYDGQMGRISGWYKRWSKVVLGLTGLVVAVIANIDTLQLAHGMYVDEPIRQAVVAQATTGNACATETTPAGQRRCAQAQIAMLESSGLPIWYPSGCSVRHWSTVDNCWNWSAADEPNGGRILLKLLGWGLTAFAVSFGAPFWFDALSKLGSLRGTGPKPAT
jgi:hypothetical protein